MSDRSESFPAPADAPAGAARGPSPARILVCDDEAAARRGIVRALGRERFSFVEASSGVECLALLESLDVDLVLLDLRMPGLDGRATLERLGETDSPPPVVVVTADSHLRTALDCVRAGAADFLAKPYDIEELRWTVERTLGRRGLERENRRLHEALHRFVGPGRLLGSSAAMEALRADLEKVGPTDASVLVRGETGTGKELVAHELHRLSHRADGPFVALNCAAVPEGLLESELFGHRKGAFTGADRDRVGRFREAHRGTLFLDEVGDMPAAAQAKLLRVLQERVVEPLGGAERIEVDVRVVAATHRDLEALCAAGDFRQDLYYRLRVVEVSLPSLRQRGRDVLELAVAFLAASGLAASGTAASGLAASGLAASGMAGPGPGGPRIDDSAAAALLAYPWPGNVRELRNAMERASIFATGARIGLDDLPAEVRAGAPSGPGEPGSAVGSDPASLLARSGDGAWPAGTDFQAAKAELVEAFERRFVLGLLERHRGNLSAAARDGGFHRQNLQKKVRQLGLDADAFR